ncbi:DUF5694 domain-containing protein [Parvularcula lutaonensis]|uniref:DUF5694 domain-containing protein n=1 Tax=Parvularcula lutaonensis TaxID=491923 RepID=A0ABV7MCS8_9PROT|nr:DUF5694 domain-containing protein [Parvularcula lutaonensis]GGY47287.1 hypothetical protein GCM10007148_15740 [Parvularcula lutaonensis]
MRVTGGVLMKAFGMACLSLLGSAFAQPAIDFSGVQEDLAGEPTRVLVLGTTHINQLEPEQFPLENLSLLLNRLEAFAPDFIAVENISGQNCELLVRYKDVYPGVADQYCPDTEKALASLGMTMPEATVALWQLRDGREGARSAADRRRLAALYLATGNPYSAVVQWYALPEDERKLGDGLTEELIAEIDKRTASRNESNVIAAVLAHRLGHDQVWPMDDHSADRILIRAEENPFPALSEHVWSAEPEGRAFYEKSLSLLQTPEGVLEAYRRLNSKKAQELTIAGDFGGAAAHSTVTRTYVAWWQARGLRMAANVVEIAGSKPEAKVLVIVGASHKAYFDAYLDQMHDIELVSVDQILND